ncbi:SlyX family protein [Aliidiomarina celeris]|uniref:SlyX family protein n=1 Tax=Aliidiomarina celeris TaxID=2249428 RepID=UPI000DEBB88D|nr:SlyX family protein [Aliidiomarina celeris]
MEHLSKRIDDLESQLAFQEDTIEALNQLVSKQTDELLRMQQQLRFIADKVAPILERDEQSQSFSAADERPPHY